MKLLFSLTLAYLLVCPIAKAAEGPWTKFLECDNGAITVDFKVIYSTYWQRTTYQVVLRHSEILHYFSSQGALDGALRTEQGEAIFLDQPKIHYEDALVRSFDQNRFFRAKQVGDGLLIEVYNAVLLNQDGYVLTREKLADWYFRSCTRY